MKNNPLMALALAFFIFMAWYKVIIMPSEEAGNTSELKNQAEDYAEKGAPEIAVRIYQQILKIKDTIEDREAIYHYLQTCVEEGSTEFGKNDLQKFVTETMEQYTTEAFAYEMGMQYWSGEQNYSKCAEIMDEAIRNNAVSDTTRSLYDELKYTYRVNSERYGMALQYSGGVIPVLGGRGWAFCNAEMTLLFQGEFDAVTICNEGSIVIRKGEDIKILNVSGQVLGAFPANGYEVAGAMGSGKIPLVKNGKYVYAEMDGTVSGEEFDMAGTFSGGLSAVQQGNQWCIIDVNGEEILPALEGVVLDEGNRCLANGRMIVQMGGRLIMCDAQGNQICELDADEAKLFGNGNYAAACIGDKWGFIDREGEWMIDPEYDDARSFMNGFAAVCLDGKWGYIDEEGKIAVDYLFDMAGDFTEYKISVVYRDSYWSTLELLCK